MQHRCLDLGIEDIGLRCFLFLFLLHNSVLTWYMNTLIRRSSGYATKKVWHLLHYTFANKAGFCPVKLFKHVWWCWVWTKLQPSVSIFTYERLLYQVDTIKPPQRTLYYIPEQQTIYSLTEYILVYMTKLGQPACEKPLKTTNMLQNHPTRHHTHHLDWISLLQQMPALNFSTWVAGWEH